MISRLSFLLFSDRIGPDMFLTHWILHFPLLKKFYLRKKLGNLGENSDIRPGCILVNTKNIYLGDNVVLRPNSMLFAASTANVYIGSNVLIGPNLQIHVNNHITSANDRPFIEQGHTNGKDLIIEDNVWIGCNVTLLEGAKICSNSIVAAGSVVNKEVTTNSIVGGVPAKLIKKRENNEN